MYWVIHWVDGGQDQAVVVEAESRAAAVCSALKRNIPVVFIGEAEPDDVREARRTNRLWKYTRETGHRCFGRTVNGFHLVCLMISAMMTAALHLERAIAGGTIAATALKFW